MTLSERNIKLLIIDDEPTLLLSLQAFLEDEGFIVTTAQTGEEALQLLDTLSFDAAIVDIRLPGINGNEVIVEASKRGISIPFLIHTGSTEYQPTKEIADLGYSMKDVFIKPVKSLNILTKAIKKRIKTT